MNQFIQNIKNTPEPAPIGAMHRFRLMQGQVTKDGRFERGNAVGVAFLKEGRNLYVLRLNTFIGARFYLAPSRDKPSRYLLMTRERAHPPISKRQYYWNVIGNGCVDTSWGVIQIKFDLLDAPIYMSLFPEPEAKAGNPPQTSRAEDADAGTDDFGAAA